MVELIVFLVLVIMILLLVVVKAIKGNNELYEELLSCRTLGLPEENARLLDEVINLRMKNKELSFQEKLCMVDEAFREASMGTVFKHDPTQLDQDKLRDVTTEEPIDYQHEITMAKRFLDKRKLTQYLSPTGKNMLSDGYLDKSEVDAILEMALKGELTQWIDKKYNQGSFPSTRIDIRKEATNG